MELDRSSVRAFAMTSIFLIAIGTVSECYDPLDPNGNITVTFDIHDWAPNGYVATVTIQNFYQYRHIGKPGWNLGWTWTRNEVILTASGAFARAQGDCSKLKYPVGPHTCKQDPVFADLTPEASPANMSSNCCRGGSISAWAIDPSNSFSSFKITVTNLEQNTTGYAPMNLALLAPGLGYTCGPVLEAEPTVSSENGGKRQTQVYRTWKSTCTYSRFLANKTPMCCVSLSTFYNSKITACPECSCGCKEADQSAVRCVSDSGGYPSDNVRCTDHMCPVRVHWHIKNNYVDHWRVKLTVSNYNYNRNYSDWNVLLQHPGLGRKTTSYSFNSTELPKVGLEDAVALFWGIPYYNDQLLQADEDQIGSVTTDILVEKDLDSFTLSNGWGFPRRIYFSGEECEMPLPDTFPMLPNGSSSTKPALCLRILLFIFLSFHTIVQEILKIESFFGCTTILIIARKI